MAGTFYIFLFFDRIIDFLLTPFRASPPNWLPQDKHRYIAPEITDLRSPCPYMNSLANHGYINRNGRGLTLYSLIKVQMDVFNFSFLLAAVLSLGGVFLCGNGLTVDLVQLRLHNAIEHDASLAHQDISTGDSWTIDPKLVQEMLDEGTAAEALTFHDFARYRVAREATLPAPMDDLHKGVADREACLVISQVGTGTTDDATKNITSKDRLRSFFLHETFPGDWKRPARPLGFFETARLSEALRADMDKYRASLKAKN